MNSASVDDFIQEIIENGYDTDPDLLHQVVALGQEAVEPLRDLLHRDMVKREDKEAQIIASCLLGNLNAREALPDIVALHRSIDFDAEDLSIATGHFGPEAFEMLLPIIQNSSASFIVRDNALLSAQFAAAGDEQTTGQLKSLLRRLLREHVDNSVETSPNDDDLLFATSLVMSLIEMRDVEAQALIEEAWDRNAFERGYYGREDIGLRLQEPLLPRPEVEDWLTNYRSEIEELNKMATLGSGPAMVPPLLRTGPIGTFQRSTPKVGRNDPCWCGSGKKYKKCHLSEDEASIIR